MHDNHVTSSFGPQLSVCACDVSHVLEIWLAHVVSSGGSTEQGGCHAHWANEWGRCVAGVQGPEQKVSKLWMYNISAGYYFIIGFPLLTGASFLILYEFVDFSRLWARTIACRTLSVWLLQSPLPVYRRQSASSRWLCRICWIGILYPVRDAFCWCCSSP